MLISNLTEITRFISEEFHDSVASGTYSIPAGSQLLWVDACAGGGGGGPAISALHTTQSGGNQRTAGGQGGQSGAAVSFLIALDSDRLDSDISWTVGGGGAGGSAIILPSSPSGDSSGSFGDSGGDTIFGDFITCAGGTPGDPAAWWSFDGQAYGGANQFNPVYDENDQNDPHDSDIARYRGVTINPVSQGHIIVSVNAGLGYAVGGQGEKGYYSDTSPSLYAADTGQSYGIFQANPGVYSTSEARSAGGGGGSTCFGAGGQGGTPEITTDDSGDGGDATLGYGGGGGGGGARYVSAAVDGKAGDGGAGAGGFIRIRAYGASQ